jgi:hypothetical protein
MGLYLRYCSTLIFFGIMNDIEANPGPVDTSKAKFNTNIKASKVY